MLQLLSHQQLPLIEQFSEIDVVVALSRNPSHRNNTARRGKGEKSLVSFQKRLSCGVYPRNLDSAIMRCNDYQCFMPCEYRAEIRDTKKIFQSLLTFIAGCGEVTWYQPIPPP